MQRGCQLLAAKRKRLPRIQLLTLPAVFRVARSRCRRVETMTDDI
jgi:hypothetical protein